jgi:hypothetical protein
VSPATHAVVASSALDLRPRPDHRAELASQLLLGEVVRFERTRPRGGWRRVRSLTDGYQGWVREWGLVPASLARVRGWQSRAAARVVEPMVLVRADPGAGGGVGPLFLGSRVIAGSRRDGHTRVELPDGRRGWVPSSALASRRRRAPGIEQRVRSLLGVPYLWGGRTAAGMDCSAFVQLVLAEQGVALARDAHEQYRQCRKLRAGESPVPGDLLFFSVAPRGRMAHVGLSLGGGWFAHARGRVLIQTMQDGTRFSAAELKTQFRGWYRTSTASRDPFSRA